MDRKPWYVGQRLPGFGWQVKARTFLDLEDDADVIRAICPDIDTASEIVRSHNALPEVIENDRRVREAHK